MATNTSRLGLLKKDTATDGNDTFNIKTMLNDNWDLIDAKVATLGPDGKVPAEQLSISVSDASTTQKGVVMLEDSVTSASVTKAATPNSVKQVNDALTSHQTDLASQSSGKGASLIGINDSDNKFSSTTVEGALSELFQFANDGKTNIATVVGSPTLSSDTFSKITSDIQTQKNNLATNLTNKGQSSTGTETLKALVDKVVNVNTGKKWASGSSLSSSSRVSFSNGTGATINAYTITVNGLDFKPTIVLVQDLISNAVAVVNLSQPLNSGYHVGWVDAIGLVRVVDNFYLQNGGFQVPSYYDSKSVNWIAFE